METVWFCLELFFWCWKPLLKLREPTLKEKPFPASGNYFLWFSCQKKQFFRIVETYFSTNTSFRVVETDFLACANHFLYFFRDSCRGKHFFCLVETYLGTNPSFRLFEKDLSLMENVTLLERFFSTNGNSHEWGPIFKDWTCSYWWKLIFWLAETSFFHSLIFFKESFIPISGNAFFSPKE